MRNDFVNIYTAQGDLKVTIGINNGAKGKFTLGKEDYVTLPFTSDIPIHFNIGDYCDLAELYDVNEGMGDKFGKRYELLQNLAPNHNPNTGGYEYELRMDAYYYKWQNKIFKYIPDTGGEETSWSLTAPLETHLAVLISNLDKLGYTYNGESFLLSKDGTVEDKAIALSYNNTNIIDALTMMAEALKCEWWVSGKSICFGKREYGEYEGEYTIHLTQGENVTELSRTDSKGTFATRLFVFGSERNIPITYRKELFFEVKERAYSSGKFVISDTLRPLDPKYFPSNYTHTKEESVGSIWFNAKEYFQDATKPQQTAPATFSSSKTSFNTTTGDYVINLKQVSLFVGRIFCYNFHKYEVELKVSYEYEDSSAQQVKNEHDNTIFKESKELPNDVLNGGRYIEFPQSYTIKCGEGKISNLMVTITLKAFDENGNNTAFNYILSNGTLGIKHVYPYKSVDVELTIGEGRKVSGVLNPTFSLEDKNKIYLSTPISIEMGDRFTIDNILTGKLPSSYFSSKNTSDVTVNGVVQKRLMLPEGIDYIDAYRYLNGRKVSIGEEGYEQGEPMPNEEAIEAVIANNDIYPKPSLEAHDVLFYEVPQKDEDGKVITDADGNPIMERFYYFKAMSRPNKDSDPVPFPFSNDYRLYNTDLEVLFTSGSLNGMSFVVSFRKAGSFAGNKKVDYDFFEIIANENNGRKLPDDVLFPNKREGENDTFVLIGWDSSCIKELGLIDMAEKELLRFGEEYIKKTMVDDGVYTATLDSAWVYSDLIKHSYAYGQKVLLSDDAYFEGERKSRILGYEINLDYPYDSPKYTIGESIQYSRIEALESKIGEIQYNGKAFQNGGGTGGSGTSIYLIKNNDATLPSEDNAYSASRSQMEFLCKTRDDSTPYDLGAKNLKADGNISAGGEVTAPMVRTPHYSPQTESGAAVYDDQKGTAHVETDYLLVRNKAVFNQLEINKLSYSSGDRIIGHAGNILEKVVPITGYGENAQESDEEHCTHYRCFFKVDDGETEVVNCWVLGDLARSQTFNIKEGVYENVKNSFYWRLVAYVGYDYVDLSKSDCAEGSDAPMKGDEIVQMGSKTDQERMGGIIFQVSGGQPSIKQYDKVNSYHFGNDEMPVIISPSLNKFTGDVYKVVNGKFIPPVLDLGEWNAINKYSYMNEVSHKDRKWRCICDTWENGQYIYIQEEPSETAKYWIEITQKGEKGDSTLTLEIHTDKGSILRNGQGEITLTAILKYGMKDITDRVNPNCFSWMRTTKNPTYDEAWNKLHENYGKTLVVSSENVYIQAQFSCSFSGDLPNII